MYKHQFWGIYAPYIIQFIDSKRSLGFKYSTEETIYSIFDRFTMEMCETKVGISKELAEKWCMQRNNESNSYWYHRCVCISQLSSYLSKIGIRSYIPRLPQQKSSFIPYIFSKNDVAALFSASDRLRAQRKMMNSMIFVIPCLLRLLYATGLRISEAVALRNCDVDLSENFLIVKDSKNCKQRMIPISKSLSTVCKDYVNHRDLLPLQKTDGDYFFISLNGSACRTDTVYRWFRKILKSAGIPFTGNHHGPRVHDLRHTFAVTSLAKMAESGVDLYCNLPILSTYLGHQSYSATNDYVRLTAEMFPQLLNNTDLLCLNVFPDIKSHETN